MRILDSNNSEDREIISNAPTINEYINTHSKENFESVNCKSDSLFQYNDLISVALNKKYINEDDKISLREWRIDPEKWGKKFN